MSRPCNAAPCIATIVSGTPTIVSPPKHAVALAVIATFDRQLSPLKSPKGVITLLPTNDKVPRRPGLGLRFGFRVSVRVWGQGQR